ncbi:uncharacterized protein [Haliotis asinina]|uniref:uncharacterized protein n=1 Tax=Haliotis asinina TaxID=109174 RepID=UPI0035326274
MTAIRVIMKGHVQASQCLKLKSLGTHSFPGSNGTVPKQQRLSGTAVFTRCLATDKDVQDNIKNFKEGKFDNMPDPSHLEHFRSGKSDPLSQKEKPPIGTYTMPHPIWNEEQLHQVKITHKEPEGKVEKMAFMTVKVFRKGFDIFSGFIFGERNEKKWLTRICFLETVAGVPGMVAAMARHMKSLRMMQRDYGWIHTLLEEAENERMHLLTALQLKQPSVFFRLAVIGSQGVFVTMFGLTYFISPRFCHRFVGYLEEEAVKTYTKCLEDIENGPMSHWKTQAAPDVAVRYWKLRADATMKDVILAIRADEAHHRLVNHTLASMKSTDFNPYKPGQ